MLANRIFTAVLTGCLVLLTVTGCPAGNQAREGGSVQQGSQTGSAAESHFERIMAMFSDEDRALLEADGLIDEDFVNNFVADGYNDEDLYYMIEPRLMMLNAEAGHGAEVVVGDPLPWRLAVSLPQPEPGRSFRNIYVGNFDYDPAQEVLLDDDTGYRLYDIESEFLTRVDLLPGDQYVSECWDFDGDGVTDRLAQVQCPASFDPAQTVDVLEAFNRDSEHLGYAWGHAMGPNIIYGDYNGDGLTDLFMSEEAFYCSDEEKDAQAFGINGEVLFTAPSTWNSPYIVAADTDGDGRDELINVIAGDVLALGIDEEPVLLETWMGLVPDDFPGVAGDLTGDGVDELLTGEGHVCDLVAATDWWLETPTDWEGMYIDGIFGCDFQIVEIPEEPEARAAAIAAQDGINSEMFLMWAGNGSLVYAEYLGELVSQIELATAGGTQHIVLLTDTRLLIWP